MSLPSRLSACVEASSSPGTAGSGICFTQTTTCMVGSLRKMGDGPFWQGSGTAVETSDPADTSGSVAFGDVPTAAGPDEAPELDVLVVGAGPAGVPAALAAHERGLHVACLDRAVFPRDKTCGDGLTASALRLLERLGVPAPGIASTQPVSTVVLRGPHGRISELPLPNDGHHAAVTTRLDLDAALVTRARDVGVEVHEARTVTG